MNARGNNIKAIMFVRVSSNAQDFERQKTALLPLIKSDGYADNEIAILEHKHSATNNARRVMKIEIEYNKTLYNYPPTYYLYIVRGSKRELMQVIEESDGTMITTDLTPSHWNQRITTKRKK